MSIRIVIPLYFTFSLKDAADAFETLLMDNKNGSVMFFNKVEGTVKICPTGMERFMKKHLQFLQLRSVLKEVMLNTNIYYVVCGNQC